MKSWVRRLVSVSLCSQYTSLWSMSNSPMTPGSQNGGMNNGLSSQFLRGSSSHYPSLSHSDTAPSTGSPLFDSGTATEVHDTSQYDANPHGRLPSAWTDVTPPSLWWKRLCTLWDGHEIMSAGCFICCDLMEESISNKVRFMCCPNQISQARYCFQFLDVYLHFLISTNNNLLSFERLWVVEVTRQ